MLLIPSAKAMGVDLVHFGVVVVVNMMIGLVTPPFGMLLFVINALTGTSLKGMIRESIPFMWLSGNNRPDFRTINYFRGKILKGLIEEIFVALLVLLIEEKYINLEDYFVDGTKVEANANKYSFVWAKNTERYEKQLAEKVKVLFEQIEALNQAEDERYGERDLEAGAGRHAHSGLGLSAPGAQSECRHGGAAAVGDDESGGIPATARPGAG